MQPWNWPLIGQNIRECPDLTRAIFADHGVNANSLRPYCIQPNAGEPYGRKVIFRSEDMEVMVALWAPDFECAPHDHGASNGVVWLAEGEFIEQQYVFDNELRAIAVHPHSIESSIVTVDKRDIHSMRAVQGGISLHIYHPPIRNMKVYDIEGRRTLIVRDDCGAWVPRDPHFIQNATLWPNTLDKNIF